MINHLDNTLLPLLNHFRCTRYFSGARKRYTDNDHLLRDCMRDMTIYQLCIRVNKEQLKNRTKPEAVNKFSSTFASTKRSCLSILHKENLTIARALGLIFKSYYVGQFERIHSKRRSNKTTTKNLTTNAHLKSLSFHFSRRNSEKGIS